MAQRSRLSLLTLAVSLSLAACNGGDDDSGNGGAPNGSGPAPAPAPAPSPAPAPAPAPAPSPSPAPSPAPAPAPSPAPAPAPAPAPTPAPAPAPDCPTPTPAKLPAADPAQSGVSHQFFKITVIDGASSQPIAGAKLTSTSGDSYTSDDNGNVAYYEPGFAGHDVWFSVARDGYSMTPDGLGITGARLRMTEGGSATVKMNKTGTPPVISAGTRQTRLLAGKVPGRAECMALQLVDSVTQRGVPLVTVTTPQGDYLSDSQGIVAYCDADHFGSTALHLSSHGYQALDKTVTLAAGQSATIAITRNNIAERLYRVTGQGTYRDSLLLGLTIPVANGALNASVTGQDSVISAVYKNKIFWTWGDTNSASYALGNFATTGGTSELPGQGGLAADKGVDISYLPSGDFVKGVIPGIRPDISKPTWMGALVNVPDASGNEQLFGTYTKALSDSESAERGLAKYDEASKTFKSVLVYGLQEEGVPGGGQAIRLRSGGKDWAQYPNHLRIPASAESLVDHASYQVFTGWRDAAATQLDVVNGEVRFQWRTGMSGAGVSQAAVKAAGLPAGQSIEDQLRDVLTGDHVQVAGGAAHWNAHRGRFVRILQQKFGTSFGGELWYAEADTPMGPWIDARKIITHDDYTFYNPYTHPYLSTDEGRTVYFEATYTSTYSGSKPTPRYNYNQMMYPRGHRRPAARDAGAGVRPRHQRARGSSCGATASRPAARRWPPASWRPTTPPRAPSPWAGMPRRARPTASS